LNKIDKKRFVLIIAILTRQSLRRGLQNSKSDLLFIGSIFSIGVSCHAPWPRYENPAETVYLFLMQKIFNNRVPHPVILYKNTKVYYKSSFT
jgi:hypothetical protein